MKTNIFGRSYAYANPRRIGAGPYSRLRVVDVAMDAWQAGYKAGYQAGYHYQARKRKRSNTV